MSSNGQDYINQRSVIRVYAESGTHPKFLTELSLNINQAALPAAIVSGDYGVRTNPAQPQPFNLFVKVYNADSAGDFYYETPILSSTYSVSNVTTALSWVMKYSVSPTGLSISQNTWDSAIKGIELICSNCRTKTNSEVLGLILSHPEFMNQLTQKLKKENPTDVTWSPTVPQNLVFAYTSPMLNDQLLATSNSSEAADMEIDLFYLKTNDSVTKVGSSVWTHTFGAASTTMDPGPKLAYTFSYDDKGTHTFVGQVNSVNHTYTYDVGNVNRNPGWQSGVMLTGVANRVNTWDLTSYCLDSDAGTNLSFDLLDGPSGLVVRANGLMSWSPVQTSSGTSQAGTYTIKVQCEDDDSNRGLSTGTLSLLINPDHLPEFVSPPTTWNLDEGVQGEVSFFVQDADGDPLTLKVDNQALIKTGKPDGAGIFTILSPDASHPNEFRVRFTPSFLQTIGATSGTFPVTFALNYDGTSGQYDSFSSKVTHTINLVVTNQDDPPIWQTIPTEQFVTEGLPFSGVTGALAIDPSPNSSTITYSFGGASTGCEVSSITINPSTGEMSGTFGYITEPICYLSLVATDSSSLDSRSSDITFNVTNTNRPLTVRGDAVTSVTVQESKNLSVNLFTIFADDDITEYDHYDTVTFTCLNCTALGLTGLQVTSSYLNWTPNNTMSDNSPYLLQIQGIDAYGSTATATLEIIVLDSPSPVVVMPSWTDNTFNENLPGHTDTYDLKLTISPASGNAIDQFNYVISDPYCVDEFNIPCRANLLISPYGMTGNGVDGTQDFTFQISPNATDGDKAYPGNSRTYGIAFTVTKSDDVTVSTEVTVNFNITNVNRAPTQIGVGILGSTAGPYTYGTSTYLVTPSINLATDRKVGGGWQNTYRVPFDILDADGTNDSYSYSIVGTSLGSFEGNVWTFKMPSCLNSGSSQITRSYLVEGSDGRGGTVQRTVQIVIRNVTTPSPICM